MALQVHLTEENLVQRLQSNDRSAFEYLYEQYCGALYGVILKVVNEEEIANDVLQEAFVKIWSNIQSYDVTKGKLFTWLLNICRNTAIDKLRSKDFRNHNKNQSTDNLVNGEGSAKSDPISPDEIGLREIVDKLDPNEKLLIDLMYFKGYTQAEVAEEFNMPLGTVKTRTRSALNNLRKIFNK